VRGDGASGYPFSVWNQFQAFFDIFDMLGAQILVSNWRLAKE